MYPNTGTYFSYNLCMDGLDLNFRYSDSISFISNSSLDESMIITNKHVCKSVAHNNQIFYMHHNFNNVDLIICV